MLHSGRASGETRPNTSIRIGQCPMCGRLGGRRCSPGVKCCRRSGVRSTHPDDPARAQVGFSLRTRRHCSTGRERLWATSRSDRCSATRCGGQPRSQNHRLLGQSAATSALVAGSAWGCGAGLLQSLVPDRLNSRSARWWPSNRARGAGASEFRLLTPQRPHSFLS